jgi:hypothetical protein
VEGGHRTGARRAARMGSRSAQTSTHARALQALRVALRIPTASHAILDTSHLCLHCLHRRTRSLVVRHAQLERGGWRHRHQVGSRAVRALPLPFNLLGFLSSFIFFLSVLFCSHWTLNFFSSHARDPLIFDPPNGTSLLFSFIILFFSVSVRLCLILVRYLFIANMWTSNASLLNYHHSLDYHYLLFN